MTRNSISVAINIFLFGIVILLSSSVHAYTGDKQIIEAEKAKAVGGASKLADNSASGKYLTSLTKAGQAVTFTNIPAGNKLAIRYTSVQTGTISVAINNQQATKVNIHSSGASTGTFLYAIIDLKIPARSTLTVSLDTNDVALNIDRIEVGNGDLGLPPDIWNLPPLPVAAGPYPANWKGLSSIYTPRMVARRQVWRMVALGSAVNA